MMNQRINLYSLFLLLIALVCICLHNMIAFAADTTIETHILAEECVQGTVTEGINWKDIFNAALGAILGFTYSWLLGKKVAKDNKVKSIHNIVAELDQMYCGIKETILSNYNEELSTLLAKDKCSSDNDKKKIRAFDRKVRLMGHVIYLPIWDAIIQTGYILEFKDKEYFEALIRVYTVLIRLQKLIDMYHDSSKDMDMMLLQEIAIVAEELKEMWENKKSPLATLRKSSK